MPNLINLHERDANGFIGARLDTGWRFSHSESPVTHSAFADNAQAGGETGHLVRAHHDAVAATDTLVVEVPDDSGQRLLLIGEYGAAVETGWINTVMAGRGDVLESG